MEQCVILRHESIIIPSCSSSLVRRRRVLLWQSCHRRQRAWPDSGDMPCRLSHGRIPHEKYIGWRDVRLLPHCGIRRDKRDYCCTSNAAYDICRDRSAASCSTDLVRRPLQRIFSSVSPTVFTQPLQVLFWRSFSLKYRCPSGVFRSQPFSSVRQMLVPCFDSNCHMSSRTFR